MQELVAEDLPVLPLWVNRNILVRDRRITGFTLTPDEDYTSVREMSIGAKGEGAPGKTPR